LKGPARALDLISFRSRPAHPLARIRPALPGGWLPAAIAAAAGIWLLPTLRLGQHSEGHYFDLLARGLDWPDFMRASWPSRADVFIRPLAFVSWKLNASLGGDSAYHLVNIGLHLAAVVLLFALARRWSGSRSFAAALASIYAFYPAHAATVGWVVARFDLLAIAAALSALLLLQRILDGRGGSGHAAAVALCFGAGLLCKESIAALPLVLSAWPLLQLRPSARLRPAAGAGFGAWVILALYLGFRVVYLDHPWGYAQVGWDLTLAQTLRDFGAALAANLILPCSAVRLGAAALAAAALLVLAVLGAAAWGRAPAAALGAALLLSAAWLAPVAAIVHWTLTEDDWYYLSAPALGIAWMLATPLLARRAPARRTAALLIGLVLIIYAVELRAQLGAWERAARRVDALAARLRPPAAAGSAPAVYVFGPPIRFPWVVGVNLLTTKLRDAPAAAARSYRYGPGLMNLDRLAWLQTLPPYRAYTEHGRPGIDAISDRLVLGGLKLGAGDSVWFWNAERLELQELTAALRRRLASSHAGPALDIELAPTPSRSGRRAELSIPPTAALAIASIRLQLDSTLLPGQLAELRWRALPRPRWHRIAFELRGGSGAALVRLFPQRCLSWALQDRPITDLRLQFPAGQELERIALESAAPDPAPAAPAVVSLRCPAPRSSDLASDIFGR